MANWVSQELGKINKEMLDLTEDGSSVLTSPVNKLWRAAILLHRATHKPHQEIDKVDPAKGKDNNVTYKEKNREKAIDKRSGMSIKVDLEPHENFIKKSKLDSPNNIILYNLTSKPYEYIVIQNRPNSIEYKGETTWATIKSMGRNTPMYHYTGAEDTVQFNISWFCNDKNNPDEVVNKCRFLEAWTKSDGYRAAPPIINIQWGNSGIFDNQKFILISATYTLSNFNDRVKNREIREATDGKLLPSTATQELIFKRVSENNITYNDILPISKMQRTRGLNSK